MRAELQALDPVRFAGRIDGRETGLFILRNDAGMSVAVCNYGARVLQILVPDGQGRIGDVALGYDCFESMAHGAPSIGAFIGRYAGRIGDSRFAWNGRECRLDANDGRHCLHGGRKGSRHRVFQVVRVEPDAITLAHRFLEAEDGFPGDLDLRLTYRLGMDNSLCVEHEATCCGEPGPASFASHIFFNLGASDSSDIARHALQVQAAQALVLDAEGIANGATARPGDTTPDFRRMRTIGATACDAAYVIDGQSGQERLCALLDCPASGRSMRVWSTEPVLQVYTADRLGVGTQPDIGKGGFVHRPRTGICLEPQQYPNAPNRSAFPLNVVGPDTPYRARTRYVFAPLAGGA